MRFKLWTVLLLGVFSFTQVNARVTVLNSPLSVQERAETAVGKLEHNLGALWGINGVLPAGTGYDSDYLALPYTLTYGLYDKVEVAAAWGLASVDAKGKSRQFGVTDLSMGVRYSFLKADSAQRQAGLDVQGGISLPTGSFDKALGTGGAGFLLNWGLTLPTQPLESYFDLGYRYFTENSDNSQSGGYFNYALGLRGAAKNLGLTSVRWQPVSFFAELKGINHARLKINGEKVGPMADELYLAPGLKYATGRAYDVFSTLLLGLTTDSSDVGLNLEVHF